MFTTSLFNFCLIDETWATPDCYDPEGDIPYENSTAYLNGFNESQTSSPVEQYWK